MSRSPRANTTNSPPKLEMPLSNRARSPKGLDSHCSVRDVRAGDLCWLPVVEGGATELLRAQVGPDQCQQILTEEEGEHAAVAEPIIDQRSQPCVRRCC